mgnify:CR=1 FL=1
MADMTNKRLSVAPMIDWTTTDYRYFARLFNPHVYLYTEMISTGALLHGNRARHLRFDTLEHPLLRPAAVTIHDNSQMPGESCTIELNHA